MSLGAIGELGQDGGKEDQALWIKDAYQVALSNCLHDRGFAAAEIGHRLCMLPAMTNSVNSKVDEVKGAEPLNADIEGVVAL